ncbi:hypothetical protein P7K49_015491, partial [Saguinus oedipus]
HPAQRLDSSVGLKEPGIQDEWEAQESQWAAWSLEHPPSNPLPALLLQDSLASSQD